MSKKVLLVNVFTGKKLKRSPSGIPAEELHRAWLAAGKPSTRGPNGGRQFFGMDFPRFYAMTKCYPLNAPDLSMAASTGLGFDKVQGYRAFVFAAGLPGYYWVALQKSVLEHPMHRHYPMMTFHSACREKDVRPTLARWAPGVKLHWTSSPGIRHIGMPYGWAVPSVYKKGKARLLFRYAETVTGPRILLSVSPRTITTRSDGSRALAVCARASMLEEITNRFTAEDGELHVDRPLLRLAYRWGATHFHNVVLKTGTPE